MRDAKNIHEELLLREDFSYRRGWRSKPGQIWLSAFLWGINLVLAIIVFGGFR